MFAIRNGGVDPKSCGMKFMGHINMFPLQARDDKTKLFFSQTFSYLQYLYQ